MRDAMEARLAVTKEHVSPEHIRAEEAAQAQEAVAPAAAARANGVFDGTETRAGTREEVESLLAVQCHHSCKRERFM